MITLEHSSRSGSQAAAGAYLGSDLEKGYLTRGKAIFSANPHKSLAFTDGSKRLLLYCYSLSRFGSKTLDLDLTSLRQSVPALKAALSRTEDSHFMASLDDVSRRTMRAGVIQHFEFVYELCWKSMKRWLELNLQPGIADGVPRRELFRLAVEQQLLTDIDAWMRYHEARNLTSHTYNPETADQIYQVIPDFAIAAERLLASLEVRND